MSTQHVPLVPTFRGYISTTADALILFEAVIRGELNHVPRRPHDRERQELIQSGNVFVYGENSSGIKRWTDGVSWSPSRILGNFLIYRELDQPFAPGEKKRALKKARKPSHSMNSYDGEPTQLSDLDRSLVGSLVDSYAFRDHGLIKKTISVTLAGISHHLVSYYSIEDVKAGKLMQPSNTDFAQKYIPRDDFVIPSQSRNPSTEDTAYNPLPSQSSHHQSSAQPLAAPYHMSMGVDAMDQSSNHHSGQHAEYTTGSMHRPYSHGSMRQPIQVSSSQFPLSHYSQHQQYPPQLPFVDSQSHAPFSVPAQPSSFVSQGPATLPHLGYAGSGQSLSAMEPRQFPRQTSSHEHNSGHNWESSFSGNWSN
ncbi:hypothetical protein Golomagni_05724 [Golovinomyces magnicellulatus]|nr:hypothetical protein Golomagni_05724 [Golovinomyces magnicellulatus]